MRRFLIYGCVVMALGQGLSAQTKGKTISDGALDRIELLGPAPESGQAVIIRPFDASDADLGTGSKGGKEARQQESTTMQNEGPRVMAERFAAELLRSGPFKAVTIAKADESLPPGAIIIEGKFVTLDPGSRTKRYLAGFGAGKSSVKVVGSVKDAAGQTLATFEQRRIGAMGIGGGDSLGKMMSDSRSIGEDVAKFLAKWARGENLE